MHSFFDLAGFEYTKIFKSKSSVIAIILTTLLAAVSPVLILTGNSYINGEVAESHYEAMIKDREYARALSGRVLDETLFTEVKEAYSKIPAVDRYTLTAEYEQYARPYSEIRYFMADIPNFSDWQSIKNITLEEMRNFYPLRHETVSERINRLGLSDKAKEKVIRIDSEITTPLIFEYTGGFHRFFVIMYSTGVFLAFAIAICLAPMFAGEYSTGASQLILSSKLGKNKLILAKLFTAFSFCTVFCLLLTILTVLVCAIVFGLDGAASPLQIYWLLNHYPITIAQAAVLFSVCILFAAILIGAFTLLLSSKFKSPFGVIIIACLLIFVPMLLPATVDNLFLYNLYMLLPINMMAVWGSLSYIPYEIFGLAIPPYIFMPVFSASLSAVMVPFIRRAFKNHQIS